jgi:AraC-like DNA-binding protein
MSKPIILDQIAINTAKADHSLIENRRIQCLSACELNTFETSVPSKFDFAFSDFVITRMVKGRKIITDLSSGSIINYQVGETLILPKLEAFNVGFPEADLGNPTQCQALVVSSDFIESTVNYLNDFNRSFEKDAEWTTNLPYYHFQKQDDISKLVERIMLICLSGDAGKQIYADLTLKELFIRLIQNQHIITIEQQIAAHHTNQSRQQHILKFIQDHLTEKIMIEDLSKQAYLNRNAFFKWFREQFGLTPVDYINKARVELAKSLLQNPSLSMQQVALQAGFSDTNYFIRIFKRLEGVTPKSYQIASVSTLRSW